MGYVNQGVVMSVFAVALLAAAPAPAQQCYRGNLHSHSLWSDGDEFPELVFDWYRRHGYHFVALTDHNILPDETRWMAVVEAERRGASLERYRERMGDAWVETRIRRDTLEFRLRAPSEFASRFEEPGRFLVVPGEEISDNFEGMQVHLNGLNLVRTIPPQGGASVAELLDNNVTAVREQGVETGRKVYAQANHPNFEWAIEAGELSGLAGVDPDGPAFFEIYNGHFLAHNAGDSTHPSADRKWDLALTDRLRKGDGMLYGVGTDDTHNYHGSGPGGARPGRGWVVVCADTLAVPALLEALEAGEFYVSTGVQLDSVERTDEGISIRIRPEEGVEYRTQFIGTRKGSDEVGEILAVTEAISPEYRFDGEGLYVRAKIISSKEKANAAHAGEFETAWTQPVVP